MKFTGAVLVSGRNHGRGRRKNGHTESVRANVVTGETEELKSIPTVKRAKVQEVLPTPPHYM